MGRAPRAGTPDPPRVGRPEHAVPVGPVLPVEEDPAEATPDEAGDEADRRVLLVLSSAAWPDFARHVVFHPLLETALPGGDLEQGPPYHIVVAAAGSVQWTDRGRSGGQAQPPGLPAESALKALHVAIPDAGRVTPERIAAVRAIWKEATRRLGDRAAMFADEVPGSTVRLPDGFDRAPYVAPQETRPKDSRPASLATQPGPAADRVKIRFGSTTIDAGIAATAAARRDGLMGRTSLRKDEGLLFVYRDSDERSFWMKNCCIALDILYVKDDGEVIALRTLSPPDPKIPEADIPRFVSPSACRLVLEVAGGYALAHGVKKGSRLGLPAYLAQLLAKADP